MSRSCALRASNLRDVFRLVGGCRELGDDLLAWRDHLLMGAALTRAAVVTGYEEV